MTSGRAFVSVEDVARALSARPTLPLPTRTRLLRELRSDLEGMTRRLVQDGLAPDEARRQAAETLLPDDVTLAELERLSVPWYRRITASLDGAALIRAERTALVLATMAILASETAILVGTGLLADPSPFLWPVLILGAVLLAAVTAKAFQLWVKGAHEHPSRGLTVIACLSALTLAVGCVGALLDLTLLAGTLEGSPHDSVRLATRWLVRDAALLSAAVILSVAGGLGWFVLSLWVVHVEHAHHEAAATPASLDHTPTSDRHLPSPSTIQENRP